MLYNKPYARGCVAVFLCAASHLASSNLAAEDAAPSIEGGFTLVAQDSDDNRVDAEAFASFDLISEIPHGPGYWLVYVEGNSSPRDSGISNSVFEANGDAGSALDRDGNGRLQVSELQYIWNSNDSFQLAMGLLDATAWLDMNAVANDETSQFINLNLVINPTIEFPDYSLGGAYHRSLQDQLGVTVVVTSSHGLADNPDASYSQLVDVTEDGKGIFGAAELQWQYHNVQLGTGIWINTADHDELNGADTDAHNHGLYANIDGSLRNGLWNIRLGMANDKVSQAARFASMALEYPLGNHTLGAGYAHTWLSDEETTSGLDDNRQAEVYVRMDVRENLSITPALQWIKNSGFDASNTMVDDSLLVFGARMTLSF